MPTGYAKRSLISFNAGELSPKLDARVDLAKYQNGCRVAKNGIIGLYGEFERRPGTEFIATEKTQSKKVRLMDFQFSTTTTFILEFGDTYIRFYSNGQQVQVLGVPYEISSPYLEAHLFQIQFAQSNDIAYLTHPNYPVQKLSRIADTNWTLVPAELNPPPFLSQNIEATTITPSGTTGTITLEADDPIFLAGHVGSYWEIAHLREASYVQLDITGDGTSGTIAVLGDFSIRTYGVWSADILVQRSLDNGTTWETVRSYAGRDDRNVDAAGNEPATALYRLEVANWAASGIPGTTTPRVVIEVVDSFFRGLVKITAFTDTDTVTALVINELGSSDPTKYWSEGAWSLVRGYPTAVTIFEQSVVYAGTSHQPQTVWKSRTDDYENFRYGSNATDAFAYTIGSKRQQTILWLIAQKALLIGTTSGEWAMSSGDNDEVLSPTNVSVKPQSEHGSKSVDARLVGDVVLFVQRNGRKVRELAYSLERDKYVAPDLTLLAEHITRSGIVQVASQQLPFNILWAVTADGKLLGMTYEREQDVVGWHVHETNGSIESVAVVYGNGDDEVWLSVRRGPGGIYRYVERFHARFDPVTPELNTFAAHDAFFVDSGKTFTPFPAAGTFTGLGHLEGRTVHILADGAVVPPQTVVGGSVTLPDGMTASKVHIGLPFETTLMPMKLDVDPTAGITQGQVKRITSIFIRFFNTLGVTFGDGETMQKLAFRSTTDPMDQPPPLFTGDKELEFDGDYSYEANIVIKQTQPLPLTVLALIVKYEIAGN
jgi:hypothetical protein